MLKTILYWYHRIMRNLHKRPGGWQNASFAKHHKKMKQYDDKG